MNEEQENLTAREEKFVCEVAFQVIPNHTRAARNAGYSPKYARQIASQLMKKEKILNAIEEKKKQLIEHSEINPKRVLIQFFVHAFANIKNLTGVRKLEDLNEIEAAPIKKIKFVPTMFGSQIKSVEMHDPGPYLKALADHFKLFGKKDDDEFEFQEIMSELVRVMKERDFDERDQTR